MDGSAHRNQHIIIACIAGALLVILARLGTDKMLPPNPSVNSIRPILATSQPAVQESGSFDTEESPIAQQARQERIEREKLRVEQDRLKREQKLLEAIAARDQAAEVTRQNQEQMDQAWPRFYKKPKKCDNSTDQGVIVDCGNHFIRERQRFEKLWAEGKFSTH